MRAMTSAKLIPDAATSIRTWPGSISGSGRSCTSSTPGPPCLVITTARIAGEPNRSAEIHRPAVDEALGGDDLLDHLAGHRGVGGHDHRRQPPVLPVLASVGRVADRRGGDVDAVRAEDRPHAPDHPRQVLIAEDG